MIFYNSRYISDICVFIDRELEGGRERKRERARGREGPFFKLLHYFDRGLVS